MNSSTYAQRNITFKTEFESWKLSIYQVGTKLIDIDNSRLKLSASSQSILECIEWWRYDKSQSLSLILNAIDLREEFVLAKEKIYLLSKIDRKKVQKFVKDQLRKGIHRKQRLNGRYLKT